MYTYICCYYQSWYYVHYYYTLFNAQSTTTTCAPSIFLSQEQNNLRSCCPWGLRVICSAKAARTLTTPKGTKTSEETLKCLSPGARAIFSVVNSRTPWRKAVYPKVMRRAPPRSPSSIGSEHRARGALVSFVLTSLVPKSLFSERANGLEQHCRDTRSRTRERAVV